MIRAGDHVHHRPTGETWVVAAVSPDGTELVCAGWPESVAPIADCPIRYEASDLSHLEMVRNTRRSGGGYRASWSTTHTCPVCEVHLERMIALYDEKDARNRARILFHPNEDDGRKRVRAVERPADIPQALIDACHGWAEVFAEGEDLGLAYERVITAARSIVWRPKTVYPPTGVACLLQLDTSDNPGAGLDETFTVGWHDGERWFDVHSTTGVNPGPWLLRWMRIDDNELEGGSR